MHPKNFDHVHQSECSVVHFLILLLPLHAYVGIYPTALLHEWDDTGWFRLRRRMNWHRLLHRSVSQLPVAAGHWRCRRAARRRDWCGWKSCSQRSEQPNIEARVSSRLSFSIQVSSPTVSSLHSNISMHHCECVLLCKANSLQKDRFWAVSYVSCSPVS